EVLSGVVEVRQDLRVAHLVLQLFDLDAEVLVHDQKIERGIVNFDLGHLPQHIPGELLEHGPPLGGHHERRVGRAVLNGAKRVAPVRLEPGALGVHRQGARLVLLEPPPGGVDVLRPLQGVPDPLPTAQLALVLAHVRSLSSGCADTPKGPTPAKGWALERYRAWPNRSVLAGPGEGAGESAGAGSGADDGAVGAGAAFASRRPLKPRT